MCKECFAYYKEEKNEKDELMKDHIEVGINFIEECFLVRNYGKFIERKAAIAGINIPRRGEYLLKISYILHDFGKSLRFFQERARGFPGHEIISAAIFYRILKNEFELTGKEAKIISLPILLHHHTMDSLRRFENLQKGISKHGRIIVTADMIYPPCIEVFDRILKEEFSINVGEFLKTHRLTIPNWMIDYINKSNIEALNPSAEELSFIYSILYPLCTADSFAACHNRGYDETSKGERVKFLKFWKALKETVKGTLQRV